MLCIIFVKIMLFVFSPFSNIKAFSEHDILGQYIWAIRNMLSILHLNFNQFAIY